MNKLLSLALLAVFCSVSYAAVANCQTPNSDPTKCDLCNTGYGYVSAKTSCVKCTLSNCILCDGDAPGASCGACADGYGVKGSGSSATCAACQLANCGLCTLDYTDCLFCKAGYGPKGSGSSATCSACTDGACASCLLKNDVCVLCKDGYAFDTNAVCTNCTNGCKTCNTVDDSCTACPTGRVLNKTDTTKQFCCPTGCTECTSASNCTTCATGLNLDKDKGTCTFGFKTGASLTFGAIVSVALFSLLF